MSNWTFPVISPSSRISSGIGRRSSPGGVGSTNHRGIDIAAPGGSPVVAPTDLRIVGAGRRGGYGNLVTGVDGSGNEYRFAHLQNFNVKPGDTISQGQMLGRVGSTGNSTGNHLHFQIQDKSGKLLTDAMQSVVKGGAKLSEDLGGLGKAVKGGATYAKDAALTALDKALETIPGVGNIWSGAKEAGIPNIFDAAKGECGLNPICYLKNWLEETGFVQRLALFIVAMVLIIGGIAFLAKGYSPIDIAKKAVA